MRALAMILTAAAMIALTGCTEPSGVVTTASEPQVWAAGPPEQAPSIMYKSADGKENDFNKARHPLTVVVFSSAPGENCCWLDPRVVAIYDRLRDLPVTVAQFAEPTEKCPHGLGCIEACNLRKGGLITICDPQKTAWAAFGEPEPNSLLLIVPGNRIKMTGTLGNYEPIVAEAERLGTREQQRLSTERIEIYD